MADRSQVVEFLANLDAEDYTDLVHDVAEKRRVRFEEKWLSEPLPSQPSRDDAAYWVAGMNLASDDSLLEMYYLQNAPDDEIRLIGVYREYFSPLGEMLLVWPGDQRIGDRNFRLAVAHVGTEDLLTLKAGERLPRGWTFEPFKRFGRR